MITGPIKSQVDAIWNAFWSGGISNPMEVIEQMTYLLFIKRLDEIERRKEKQASRLKQQFNDPIFNKRQQKLRWSNFKELGDAGTLYKT
ncbi:MAG: type I restriction-modification system subunit M N-terminal domain-containing protein, partial [Gemmatimonas sp.]